MAIACISAFPAMINPGMVSCDLALDSVLARLGVADKVDRYNLEQTRTVGPIHSRHLADVDRLGRYRAILFWGDFQHFMNYAEFDLLRRERTRARKSGTSVDRQRFLRSWLGRAFLVDRPELRRRTVVFGETIYGATGIDIGNRPYGRALTRLLADAADVQFRDPLSVALGLQLAPEGRIAFGCDCAFLLDADTALPMAAATRALGKSLPSRYAAVAFGRSGEDERLREFAKMLARREEVELVPIEWLAPPRSSPLETIARNIAVVRGARFVVTDIYHLIVTALREGREAVGVGWGASRGRTTLDDKKKELLLRSYFGRHLYTFIEDIVEDTDKAAGRASTGLREERRRRMVTQACQRHRRASEARFGAALRPLLEA